MANLKDWFNKLVQPLSSPDKSFNDLQIVPTADAPYGVGSNLFYNFEQPTVSKIVPKSFPSLMSIYPPANPGPTT